MTFGEKMGQLVEEHGLSLRKLGKLVPCDDGYLSRVRRGLYMPSEEMAERLDEVLDAGGSLAALRPKSQPGKTGGIVDQSPTPDQEDDDVKRRAALQIITAVAAGTAIPPGAFETAFSGLDEVLGQPVNIDDWQRAVREYCHLTPRQPNTGALIRDLTADSIAIGELIRREKTSSTKNELLHISAVLSALLAVQLFGTGNRREGRMSWTLARRAADTSNDQDLRTYIRSREAETGLWAGIPPADIKALVDEAAAISKGTPSAGLVRAYAVQAELAAMRGDGDSASRALNGMAEAFTNLPSTDSNYFWVSGESFYYWTQAYVHATTGNARSQEAVEETFSRTPIWATGSLANLRLVHSMGMVRSRDISEGLDEALSTLHECVTPRSLFREHMSIQILAALPPKARTLPAARELRALISG
ncbi:helix-turn-helix domain-containing protein [Actinomadura roseirufa]|uniref:helix-turn-helix domain-containing protein n=1 Tax=Actinomadura roseirufa TaxID=2094049 RepID=UPI0010415147|nr:helix-turn-helix transcriptional regulator [Actinomadura roseirufa]